LGRALVCDPISYRQIKDMMGQMAADLSEASKRLSIQPKPWLLLITPSS
jgi:hypothetical protein